MSVHDGSRSSGDVGRTVSRRPSSETKVCPRCGARLFEDMDVCYGCLYDFSRAGGRGDVTPPVRDGAGAPLREDISQGWPADDDLVPWDDADLWQDVDLGEGLLARDVPPPSPPSPSVEVSPDSQDIRTQPLVGINKAVKQAFPAHLSSSAPRYALRVCSEGLTVCCPVTEDGISIGRGADNDVILGRRTVSRHHVRVFPSTGKGVMVEDQGATNPASIDGVPLQGISALSVGSTLDVCGTTCVLVAAETS